VVHALAHDCGCGWGVIERQTDEDEVVAARYLREAVQGTEFRLLQSFPIRASDTTQVDVYEYRGPLDMP